jgi:hypothetical protein
METDMINQCPSPAMAHREDLPGDMLIAAIEASSDRIAARFERAIWGVTCCNLFVFAIAALVLLW